MEIFTETDCRPGSLFLSVRSTVAVKVLGFFVQHICAGVRLPQLTTTPGCADRHLNVANETPTNAQIAARYFPTTNTSNWPDSAVDRNS
jgi:hypothetical protein